MTNGGKIPAMDRNHRVGPRDRKVAISKYVEQIELQERSERLDKRSGIAPPIQRRSRSNSMSQMERARHARSRSNSRNRFSTVHLHNSFDEEESQTKGRKIKRFFSFRRRKKDKRDDYDDEDDWSSSSDSSDDDDYSDDGGGFFSAFR